MATTRATFKTGDHVTHVNTATDANLRLRDGRGRNYRPNRGRVIAVKKTDVGSYTYEVEFPGPENVGREVIPIAEHFLVSA